jgi:CO/xanthine dehydrogenase Mo-binding subunit
MNVDNNKAMENKRPRPDVLEKVIGTAKYAADMYPPNVAYARIIRFPFGTGKVTAADVEKARKVPGVLQVSVDLKKEANYAGDEVGADHCGFEECGGGRDRGAGTEVRVQGFADGRDEAVRGGS